MYWPKTKRSMQASQSYIGRILAPDWNPPAGVRSCFTYRKGGFSEKPYDTFNMGSNVGDSASNVQKNRKILKKSCGLRKEPLWLTQVHGNKVVDSSRNKAGIEADGCVTSTRSLACVVTVADCLPILISDIYGNQVAAIHAGWRGLKNHILSKAIESFKSPPSDLIVWIGPSISRMNYEVDTDFKTRFESLPSFSENDFYKNGRKLFFDLKGYASRELRRCGVENVKLNERCVHAEKRFFYSYRREGNCGRMAALIWKV